MQDGLTAAASYDKRLIYARGATMAQEVRDEGTHVALGEAASYHRLFLDFPAISLTAPSSLSPVAGPLGRSPWGGRTWERCYRRGCFRHVRL